MPNQALTKILTVRISEADDRALEQLAAQAGETNRTRLVRKLICEAAGSGPYLLDGGLQSFREAVREVRSVGINLNQFVHAIHGGKVQLAQAHDLELIRDVAGTVEALRREINEIIIRSRNR